jgi:hypothetical protein
MTIAINSTKITCKQLVSDLHVRNDLGWLSGENRLTCNMNAFPVCVQSHLFYFFSVPDPRTEYVDLQMGGEHDIKGKSVQRS